MSTFSDTDLRPDTVARAREGDDAACAAIYRAFERPVRTLTRRLVARRAVADELAQDVFVDLLCNLRQYDGRGSFAGWVRSIAVNKCLMHLRSPWHRSLCWLDEAVGAGLRDESSTSAGAGGEDVDLDLEHALGRLGSTARLVVWLHDVEGYTHAEIGALLGGTASLSKSQLARAHARLRELLESPGGAARCIPVSTSG